MYNALQDFVTVSTFVDTVRPIERKKLNKAVKAFLQTTLPCGIVGADSQIKYLRAKQKSAYHALNEAGLYSIRVEGRKIRVI